MNGLYVRATNLVLFTHKLLGFLGVDLVEVETGDVALGSVHGTGKRDVWVERRGGHLKGKS